MKKIAFYTQGCRLNQSESAALEHGVSEQEFQVVPFGPEADIFVVNTCTVTENGDADTRRLVNKINTFNQHAQIALIGCQSQILQEKLLALKNVKWVIGNAEKMKLESIILETQGAEAPVVRTQKITREAFTIAKTAVDTHHTRANIKIQDGCDFYCAFCVIPFARGPARSRVFEDIIRETVNLSEAGHKEVVLTGINIGTYEHEGKTVLDVVSAIEKVAGIKRIRISSIEPTTIPKELILKMNDQQKLCRHLHIPIQSGSASVLEAMNRRYTISEFRDFVQFAYQNVSGIGIGTDVIVGFPGETKAHFDETVANLMTLPIHYFHVFSYSERQFARSKKLPDPVDAQTIEHRSKTLRDLSKKKQVAFHEQFLGSLQTVLFEQEKHGFWTGITDNYIRVKVSSSLDLKNTFAPVRLERCDGQSVIGTLA